MKLTHRGWVSLAALSVIAALEAAAKSSVHYLAKQPDHPLIDIADSVMQMLPFAIIIIPFYRLPKTPPPPESSS